MIVGRTREVEIFRTLLNSGSSELLAVYGRRRVGKTFLIRKVYEDSMVFELTGLHRGTLKDQLQNFHSQLTSSSKIFEKKELSKDWFSAFQLLEKLLDGKRSKKKKVIFIDEFPWIATARSKFLMAFEHFWNTYCTKRNDLVVVVCGSAASFMVNRIIKNKGGLHNRLSQVVRLLPFTLNETELFLKSKQIDLNRYDILQLYMAIGGVPHYLNQIRKGESVAQNIDRICFAEHGPLTNEFNEVFTSLFNNSKVHETIIRTLSKTKKGTTRAQLLTMCGLGSGGVFSKALHELIESGFVETYQPFGKKTKDSLYRPSDEYSLFYLKFIEKNRGQGSGTWANLFPKQAYKVWSGLAFETICLKHIAQIKKELGVASIYTISSSWHDTEAQIDLVIDRDDGIINICEMKFYNGQFAINRPEYDNLKNKLLQFKLSTKTRKNVFLTMVTTYGIRQNANGLEIVQNDLTMNCLFEAS